MMLPLKNQGTGLFKIPQIGLGTWKSSPNEVAEAVKAAVRHGYRHIDCAEVYGNEKEIGSALRELIEQGVVKRDELFITSKVFNNHHGGRVHASFSKTLNDLQISYLDLYLMHWPIKFHNETIPTPMRDSIGNPNPEIKMEVEFIETWREMEKLLTSGKVRNLGVSNFTKEQLEVLEKESQILPAVNQIEFHPYLFQEDLLKFCKSRGILVTAYSPLGSSDSYSGKLPGAPSLLKNKTVIGIAEKKKVTPAQVLLRWGLQHEVVVIPKSTKESRILENYQITNFELTKEEMKQINDQNRNHRFGMGWIPGHYFHIEE